MPAPDVKNDKNDRAQLLAVAAVVAGAVAVTLAIPFLLGLALWRVLRDQLGRGEWIALGGASLVGITITIKGTMSSYLGWMKALVFGGDRLAVPVLTVLALAILFAAGIALVQGTTVAGRVMTKFRKDKDLSLIPDDDEIEALERVGFPQGDVVVGHDSHSLATGGEIGKRTFPIGIDRSGKPAILSEDEIKTHMVVLGATGSGKTESLKNIAGNLMDLGWQVVVVDLKEDTAPGGLRDFLRTYAYSHAQYYQELALSTSDPRFWFNPLYGMEPDEAMNAILSLQSFDDGYWQAINRTMIGQIVTLFYDAHQVDPHKFPAPDMYTIGQTLRQPDLRLATKEMRAVVEAALPHRTSDNFSSLGKPSDDDRKSAAGLGARIINMYESEAGRAVLRAGGNRDVLDVTAPGVCYIGLNTLGLSELARVVSTSVLLRLAALAGARTTGATQKGNTRIAVIIDEANWIDRKNVQNLLSRARSAGLSVILATQGANDWNDENGQDWEKIVNNVNVGIVMRQGGSESAELCSEFIGKERKTTMMSQILDGEATGVASAREVEEYRVSPDQLRGLLVGQAILRVGVPAPRLAWVKVAQRDPLLGAGGRRLQNPEAVAEAAGQQPTRSRIRRAEDAAPSIARLPEEPQTTIPFAGTPGADAPGGNSAPAMGGASAPTQDPPPMSSPMPPTAPPEPQGGDGWVKL